MTRPKGPFGIDPLAFSFTLFGLLLLFVLYLILPRGLRKQYFSAYPRRHAWSARSRVRRSRGYGDVSYDESALIEAWVSCFYIVFNGFQADGSHLFLLGILLAHVTNSNLLRLILFTSQQSLGGGSITGASSVATGTTFGTHGHPGSHRNIHGVGIGASHSIAGSTIGGNTAYSNMTGRRGFDEEQVVFGGGAANPGGASQMLDIQQNEEIVISAAMQQLRDPGVLIVAHGSRGKPKTVRLQLTESAVTWRTETRKKGSAKDAKPKMGKLHQVPLSHIMYVSRSSPSFLVSLMKR